MGCIACAALVLDGAGVTLTRREASPVPVEAKSICPDRFMGLGTPQIADLPLTFGGETVRLGDLFEVDGAGPDNVLVNGDLRAVSGVAERMSLGRLIVDGDAGSRLGAAMSGGEIVVQGAAGDRLGDQLSGGRIVVAGAAGEWAGAGMLAGSIIVGGRLGAHAGEGMKGGTIAVFGVAPELPPAFSFAGLCRPESLRRQVQELEAAGLIESGLFADVEMRRYVGEGDGEKRGEILIRDQSE